MDKLFTYYTTISLKIKGVIFRLTHGFIGGILRKFKSSNNKGDFMKIIMNMEAMQEMLKVPDMIKMRENAGVIFETQKMIKLVE